MYRSPRFRAAWTLLFLALFGAVLVASALSTIAEIGLLERIADGEPVSNSEVTANDNRQRAVSSLYFMSFLATVVAFCLWIYRASANLGAMGVEGQRFSPRWAVIWLFVPVMQLFRPYQVVSEIWKGSQPGAPPDQWRQAPKSPLLGWWWGAWVAAYLSNSAILPALLRGGEASHRITAGQIALARDAFMLAATVLAILVIRQITSLQEEKNRKMAKSDVAYPPAP